MTNNMRPGVYSIYTVTSGYAAPRSRQGVGLAIKGPAALAGQAKSFTGMAQAKEALSPVPGSERILTCCRVLFESGVSRVVLSTVKGSDYLAALSLLEKTEGIGAVICDGQDKITLSAALDSVKRSSENLRERVLYLGFDLPEDALAKAAELCHERVVIACPAVTVGQGDADSVYAACAVAAMALTADSPVVRFSGHMLEALSSANSLVEEEIQRLMAAGVTVLEEIGGGVQCVRALTTRTSFNGVADYSMRELNTILIVDEVMRGVRDCLKARLAGAKSLSLQSIASQVMVELSDKADEGLIESFSPPNVKADGADPSISLVEISFNVAHVINQIHITAQIQL